MYIIDLYVLFVDIIYHAVYLYVNYVFMRTVGHIIVS